MKAVLPIILLLALSLPPATAGAASEDSYGFTAQPDRCIALHQGQVCYQDVSFSWTTPAEGDYCLYQLERAEALTCWNGNQRAYYDMDFASSTSVIYQIRTREGTEVLSQVTVEVAWVYRTSRKSFSRWRLF